MDEEEKLYWYLIPSEVIKIHFSDVFCEHSQ